MFASKRSCFPFLALQDDPYSIPDFWKRWSFGTVAPCLTTFSATRSVTNPNVKELLPKAKNAKSHSLTWEGRNGTPRNCWPNLFKTVSLFFADGNSTAAAHNRKSRNLLLRRRWSRVPVIDVEQIPGSLGVQCGIVVYSQSFRNFGRLVLGRIEADFCNTRSTRLAHLCTAPSSKYKQKCVRLSHIFKMSSGTRESMRMNSLCLTVTVESGIDFT